MKLERFLSKMLPARVPWNLLLVCPHTNKKPQVSIIDAYVHCNSIINADMPDNSYFHHITVSLMLLDAYRNLRGIILELFLYTGKVSKQSSIFSVIPD